MIRIRKRTAGVEVIAAGGIEPLAAGCLFGAYR